MKKTPITERIVRAMDGRSKVPYSELLRAVFPKDQYPRAWNYQANGGPPGCAMAFGAALRRIGLVNLWDENTESNHVYVDSTGRFAEAKKKLGV